LVTLFFNLLGTGKELTMSIASIESRRPRNLENWLRFPNQTKAIGSEESDEHLLLGDLARFVENSDQSMPRIAALMGVSDAVLSMWIAGTIEPTTIKLLEIRRFLERNRLEHVDGSMEPRG
jgi:hypothetical protein